MLTWNLEATASMASLPSYSPLPWAASLSSRHLRKGFLLPLPPQVRGLRSARPFPVSCRENAEARTLRRNTGNPLQRAGLQVGKTGLLRRSNTRPPATFRDVIQAARASRVRTSRPAVPEVWTPIARPFPARQKPAPPVCVWTGRGGSAREKAGLGEASSLPLPSRSFALCY